MILSIRIFSVSQYIYICTLYYCVIFLSITGAIWDNMHCCLLLVVGTTYHHHILKALKTPGHCDVGVVLERTIELSKHPYKARNSNIVRPKLGQTWATFQHYQTSNLPNLQIWVRVRSSTSKYILWKLGTSWRLLACARRQILEN